MTDKEKMQQILQGAALFRKGDLSTGLRIICDATKGRLINNLRGPSAKNLALALDSHGCKSASSDISTNGIEGQSPATSSSTIVPPPAPAALANGEASVKTRAPVIIPPVRNGTMQEDPGVEQTLEMQALRIQEAAQAAQQQYVEAYQQQLREIEQKQQEA